MSTNSILEVSVLSTDQSKSLKRSFEDSIDGQTPHTLFLGEKNMLSLQLKNNSDSPLVFEKGMKMKMSFETLLSKEEVDTITLEKEHWTHSVVENREVNGKMFYSFVITPESEYVLGKAETVSFELAVSPKRDPTISQLSVQFEKLKDGNRNLVTRVNDKEFLLLLRTFRISDKLELISGIVGDDILYYSTTENIETKFDVFLINPGLDIDCSNESSKLRVQLGDKFKTSIVKLDGNEKKAGETKKWNVLLTETWKEGETKMLKFSCKLKFSADLVTNLKIEYLNIPNYNIGTTYIPIKVMKQRQIGSEALSIKMDNDVIHIG